MSSNPTLELDATTMVALRREPDALQAIITQLKVKEMGPADYIRTKHEVKAWLEGQSEMKEAAEIIERARLRREDQTQRLTQRMDERQQQGQQMGL